MGEILKKCSQTSIVWKELSCCVDKMAGLCLLAMHRKSTGILDRVLNHLTRKVPVEKLGKRGVSTSSFCCFAGSAAQEFVEQVLHIGRAMKAVSRI